MSQSEFKERMVELIRACEWMVYVLGEAKDRAVRYGDELVELGVPDYNRGQFLSLVDGAIERMEKAIEG